VLYGFASEEARAWGFGSLRDIPVPAGSATFKAATGHGIHEDKTATDIWFPLKETSAELWEEAVQLGASSRALTLLSWANYGN
jgi:hypothetical protein